MYQGLVNSQHFTSLIGLRAWGARGVTFTMPDSDDPTYVTQCAQGLIRVWWGRAHVDQWAGVCQADDLVDPPEELITGTSHHVYATFAELDEVVGYWVAFGRLPA